MIGVVIGATLGVAFGTHPWIWRYGNEDLGALGLLVIRLLKALATPLILLAVLDSFLTTALGPRTFGRFVAICLTNTWGTMSDKTGVLREMRRLAPNPHTRLLSVYSEASVPARREW